jgi:cell division protein FtsB
LRKPWNWAIKKAAAPENMPLPDDTPRLPKLPFLAIDGVLLLTAWLIAGLSEKPLHTASLVGIVVCVVVGAIAAAIPFLADYQRQLDLTATDRQRALEALARTTTETAEQISIAATGLHTITEQARKNLEAAGQLPQQLAEKISSLNQRLVDSAAAETAGLRTELKALRAAEAAKVETAAGKLAHVTAELARFEHTLREQAVANESRRAELKTLRAAEAARMEAAAGAMATALADLTKLEASLRERLAEPVPTTAPAPTAVAPPADGPAAAEVPKADWARTVPPVPLPPVLEPAEIAVPAPEPPSPEAMAAAAEIAAEAEAHANVLAKVVTREEIELTMPPFAPQPFPPHKISAPVAASEVAAAPAEPAAPKEAGPKRKRAKPVETAKPAEPVAPAPAVTPAEEAVVPPPVVDLPTPTPAVAAEPEPPSGGPTGEPSYEPPSFNASMQELGLEDDTALSPNAGFITESFPTRAPFMIAAVARPPAMASQEERSISSDGFTRLVATAYIGIGNKLFVRGDGPGLSWDKGVPLQFVSIGKWRWETPDATKSITVKLYKNDQQECTSLGPVTLEPGNQHEVTADF